MTNEELKKQIDGMNYYALLQLWRFAPSGNPMFEGEVGDYYAKVMNEKRQAVGPAEHTSTSKSLGW
jgi:hypothetical protein